MRKNQRLHRNYAILQHKLCNLNHGIHCNIVEFIWVSREQIWTNPKLDEYALRHAAGHALQLTAQPQWN
jgi:hypothetical protein